MVNRVIHTDTLAAIAAGGFFPIVMVSLDWPDGPVYAHSNVGDISWNGQTWRGLGHFGRISTPEEQLGIAQSTAILELVGAPDEIDDYLEADIRGRMGEVFFGVVTERMGNQFIGEPWSDFTGYMDAMTDSITSDNGDILRTLSIALANGPSQRKFTSVFHTDEDQRRLYPDDTAGRLVINAEERLRGLTWPE